MSTTGSLMESKTPWGVSARYSNAKVHYHLTFVSREPEVKNIISSNPQGINSK